MGKAARRWARTLEAWAIPEHILAAAPKSPWGFPTELFKHRGDERSADTPSHQRALEALPADGSVLDVGVGAGAGSLVLHPRAGRVTGVDESENMLVEFARAADEFGIDHDGVRGRWPDVAPRVGPADVVVCHHVLYNVPDIEPFVLELTRHARNRVVVELTAIHPLVNLNELWRHFHDLDRPLGPGITDAMAVLQEMGIAAALESWQRPPRRYEDRGALVAFVRRRLCLPQDRDPEVDALLGDAPVLSPREVATIWWGPGPRQQ